MPPAKPAKLRALEGNPGKRPLPNEPKPELGVSSTPPAWLSAEARKEWRRVVPDLDKIGLLARVDAAALETYCEAVATHREATKIIRREGLVYEGPHGMISHPAVKIAGDAMSKSLAFAREFGLTPAARAKINLPEVPEDELAKLLA